MGRGLERYVDGACWVARDDGLAGADGTRLARGVATVVRRRGHRGVTILVGGAASADEATRSAWMRGFVLAGFVVEDVGEIAEDALRRAGPDAVAVYFTGDDDDAVRITCLGPAFSAADLDEAVEACTAERLCAGAGLAFRGPLEAALTRIAARAAAGFDHGERTDQHGTHAEQIRTQTDNTAVDS